MSKKGTFISALYNGPKEEWRGLYTGLFLVHKNGWVLPQNEIIWFLFYIDLASLNLYLPCLSHSLSSQYVIHNLSCWGKTRFTTNGKFSPSTQYPGVQETMPWKIENKIIYPNTKILYEMPPHSTDSTILWLYHELHLIMMYLMTWETCKVNIILCPSDTTIWCIGMPEYQRNSEEIRRTQLSPLGLLLDLSQLALWLLTNCLTPTGAQFPPKSSAELAAKANDVGFQESFSPLLPCW